MKLKITLFLFTVLFFGSAFAQTQKKMANQLSVSGKNLKGKEINILKPGENLNDNRNVDDEWIHWDNGENSYSIGLPNGGSYTVAARWTGSQLTAYNGDKVTKVNVFIAETDFTSIVLKIWTGTNASNLIYQKQLTNITPDSWKETILPTDIIINSGQEFWVGYSILGQEPTKYAAGADNGPAVAGYGDMILFDGFDWEALSVSNPNLNYNWNIQFYVEGQSSAITANFSASNTNITTGQSVQFTNTSTGSTSWSWKFDGGTPSTSTQKNPIVTYNTIGTFDVKLTAKDGANQDVELKNNFITVSSGGGGELEVEITADPGTSICEFGSVNLTATATGATGSYQYTWTWDIDGQIITGNIFNKTNLLVSAEVYLVVSSGGQQVEKTTVITVHDNPPASVIGKGSPDRMLICPHPDLQYQWYNNNLAMQGAQKQFYYPGVSSTLSGVYYVATTNQEGCVSYSENFTVSSDKSTFIDDQSGIISAYPNPSNGTFSIDLNPELVISEIKEYSIKLYSVAGVKVWESSFNSDFTFNIRPNVKLSSGIYILKLYGDNELFDTQKLLVN
ncbi:MAG: PKD domain-containing protein [Bacteroidetes bacterium]|nr:PKD domain-containing protein [Bacteroidota bacterium]